MKVRMSSNLSVMISGAAHGVSVSRTLQPIAKPTTRQPASERRHGWIAFAGSSLFGATGPSLYDYLRGGSEGPRIRFPRRDVGVRPAICPRTGPRAARTAGHLARRFA